jgi:hypothetical protein
MKKIAQLALAFFGILNAANAMAQPPVFSAEALQQDFRVLQDAISATHPDPAIYVSPEKLKKTYSNIAAQIQEPLTRDQAWRVLAQLNPVFSDAHLLVSQPDWEDQIKAHLKSGGALFPFDVQVASSGEMRIRSQLDGRATSLAGTRIELINGIPVSRIARALLPLVSADTPELGAHLLSRRMWFYYWKVYGAPKHFDLVLSKPGARVLSVAGSTTTPLSVAGHTESQFEKLFRFEILGKDAALLTVNQFSWSDKPAFYAFTREVFTKLRDARIGTLIIDIRENTGGDDDMWKEGILRYIANKPYRHASSYVKKVIAGRASGTERVGDVVHGFVDSWTQPELENPLRFSGKTYVLAGRLTYSSAILFSNVLQDFGFAQLVSAGSYANVRQSGGVQHVVLPNTGLAISVPRFVLDRPSGERKPVLLQPDIVLSDSPFDDRALVNALLLRIAQRRSP